MRDNTPEKPEDVEVRLKPVLGVKPTTYLPVFYGALIVVILFLVFMLPGLVRSGTVFTVVSTPPNAAVAVDGLIIGSSESEIFVPAGARLITVSKAGHASYSRESEVRGRLVGSLFFPRRETLTVTLRANAQQELIRAAVDEFSRWSMNGEASGQYQFPPIARELGRNLAGLNDPRGYDEFTVAAIAHADSEAQLNDLIAGSLLAHSGGSAPGPLSIAAVVQSAARVAAAAPAWPAQLDVALGGIRAQAVTDSGWGAAGAEYLEALAGSPRVEPAAQRGLVRTIAGIGFVEVPAGAGLVGGTDRAERGGEFPVEVAVGRFLVSQTEITAADFERFVDAVPEWAVTNRSLLMRDGLVDGDYLRDWELAAPVSSAPVRNVSYYAAAAFAEWFSGEIAGSGLAAALPTEAQWDYLAALDAPDNGVFARPDSEGPSTVGESGRGSLGLYGVIGNVWEWTRDPFATYARLHPDAEYGSDAAHMVVRGGGWATRAGDFIIDDRGSMAADWCSPAVGFRLVLAER